MFKLVSTDHYNRRQFGSTNKRVIFFFCGWMTKYWVYFPLFPIMVACGYRVYVYELNHKHILASDNNKYVEQVKAVKDDVAKVLSKLPESIQAFTFGNSLGSESALFVLKHTPQIKAAVLNTVRGNIADFLWDLPYGADFKARYLKLGYTKDRLAKELLTVEPTYQLGLVAGRPLLVYYSKSDTVITPENTKILLKELDSKSIRHRVYSGKYLNHFGISTLNHARFWRWLAFLRAAEK